MDFQSISLIILIVLLVVGLVLLFLELTGYGRNAYSTFFINKIGPNYNNWMHMPSFMIKFGIILTTCSIVLLVVRAVLIHYLG